jgi:membrane protease YdiL (CAAX protease family)
VEKNPLEHYMRTPLEAGIFLVVVMLAGGIREELQRAFILHRFEQALGRVRIGLVIFSIIFGLLHIYEGVDAAVAIGLLGLFWGVLYIRRRSVVMPMVNHACFNGLQVVQVMIARSLGAI